MAVLGLAESGLSLFHVHHPASFFTSDKDLGYVLRPNAEGWNVEEGDCYIKINSDGLRDREHTVQRPADVLRVAVVGDSTTEAYQIPQEKNYVSLAERDLKRMTRKKVETLNFGVLGYNLTQELIVLPTKVWKYDPQIVVLSLSMNAAILKSLRSLYFGDTQNAPFFELQNGALTLDQQSREFQATYHPSVRRDRLMNYINRNELLCLMNAARVQTGLRLNSLESSLEPKAQAAGATLAERAAYEREWPYIGPVNEPLKQAWDVSLKIMLAIRDEVARHHAELWIVTLDMPMQSFPDPAVRQAFQQRMGVDSLYVADNLIAKFAEENRIHHVTLAPQLTRYVDQTHQVIHMNDRDGEFASGHLNEIGHREVAERLACAIATGSDLLN